MLKLEQDLDWSGKKKKNLNENLKTIRKKGIMEVTLDECF